MEFYIYNITHKQINQSKVNGIKIIQHKFKSSLIRNRGKDLRITRIKSKIKKAHNSKNLEVLIDERKKDLKTIIKFSPKKIKENSNPPYSTLKPDTNSDSPSDKSNGDRLFSIIRLISNKMKKIKVKFKEKNKLFNFMNFKNLTVENKIQNQNKIKLITISYDKDWTILRIPPINEYLEFLDHPDSKVG